MISERLQGRPNPSILRVLDALADVEGGEPCDDAVLLAQVRNAVDLLLADCARTIEEEMLFEGYLNPCQWFRNEAKLPTGAAMAVIDVGQEIGGLPRTEAALEAGQVGFSHVALMAEARHELGAAFDEERLLEKARTQTVSGFRKTVEHALHASNRERFAEKELRARDDRFLKLSPGAAGSLWVKGWLEPEGASVVRSALEPLARRDAADDYRTREQRLGDALVELAGAGVKTELVVTVPLETLLAAPGAPAAETEWGGIVSSDVVRRLLCDADVRRLVLDGDDEVVDFGRRKRLFAGPSKKALAARDGHCVFPGCDRPPRWCDRHHRKGYAEGGGTDLRNGALLCGRHHHLVHEGGWTLVWEGTRCVAIPPRRWPPPERTEAA